MNPAHVEAGESLKTAVVVNEAVQALEAAKIHSKAQTHCLHSEGLAPRSPPPLNNAG
jgi:hypothetical protein